MFWRNFTTIRRICIPYKFGQSGCIPPKIICEIFVKVRKQLAPRLGISRLIKPQTNGTTGPPSACDNRSRFPGKSIALQHAYVFYNPQSSEIQDVDAIHWAKTPKAKAKPVPKRSKAENVPLKNKTLLVTNRRTA